MVAIIAGEEPRSIDPTVSEWGNPTIIIFGYPMVKIPTCRGITVAGETARTETSK